MAEWRGSDGAILRAIGLDLRGADLSGCDLSDAWLTGASLIGVSLAGACLYGAHLEFADLTGADLTGAHLGKVEMDEAVLRSARLTGADLMRASLAKVDARSASFRGAVLTRTSLWGADLRGADLSDATVDWTSLRRARVDGSTTVEGLSGTVRGAVTLVADTEEIELDGDDLQAWLSGHGATATVAVPVARDRADRTPVDVRSTAVADPAERRDELVLRSVRDEDGTSVRSVHLTAAGELVVEGHDLGPGVERHFGLREYEFQRRLSGDQTQRLRALLDATDQDDLLHVIGNRFNDTFH
ncbi:MAG: pentapeptide repeat-containing protein, partial [Pseudonocardia sp.]